MLNFYRDDSAILTDIAKKISVKANTIVLIGDSITAANGYGSEKASEESAGVYKYYYYNQRGFFTWGNIFLGQRMNMLANLGIGGQTSAQILARVQSAIDLKPNYCHLLSGTNDSGTADETISNIKSTVESLLNNGICVIVGTLIPKSTTDLTKWHKINRAIREYASTTNGVICADYYSYIADSVTGLPKTNTLLDGTHPNAYGGYLMGQCFYECIKNHLLEPYELPFANAGGQNLLTNPMFNGSSGNVALNWNSTGSGTPLKVASTDFFNDSWQQYTMTSGQTAVLTQTVNFTDWVTGDKIYAIIEVDASSITSFNDLWFRIRCNDSELAVSITPFISAVDKLTGLTGISNIKGVLKTPIMPIMAGTTTIALVLKADFTGVIKVRRAGLFKVTQ